MAGKAKEVTKSKAIFIRLEPEVRQKLQEEADKLGVGASTLVRMWVLSHLNMSKKEGTSLPEGIVVPEKITAEEILRRREAGKKVEAVRELIIKTAKNTLNLGEMVIEGRREWEERGES